MAKVTLLVSQPRAFLSRVRRLARDSETIGLPLRDRNPDRVTPAQMFYVLEHGVLLDSPYANEHNDVIAELQATSAGDTVRLTVLLEQEGGFLRILIAEK